MPVPERHGEPSVFKHVIYVIKENRTYDQVFGDMKEGNGDPNLCIFGEEVTPNHHKLAREFTLLDNFYCSGVLSADGHSVGQRGLRHRLPGEGVRRLHAQLPLRGRATRSPSPSSGFLWDNALARKKTFRNYGEFVKTPTTPKGANWADLYADYTNGTGKVKVDGHAERPVARAVHAPELPRLPAVDRPTSTGPSCSSTS